MTGLIAAASSGFVQAEQRIDFFMTEHNANTALKDKFSNTPLHILIVNESLIHALYYLESAQEKGVKIDFNKLDAHSQTTLILAVKTMQSPTVLAILKQKESHNTNLDVNFADSEKRTAMHYACILQNAEMIRALFTSGASLTKRDSRGRTPLDYLALLPDVVIENNIKAILQSVSIDPDRDENALWNTIVTDRYQFPIVIDGENKIHFFENVPAQSTSQGIIEEILKQPVITETGRQSVISRIPSEKRNPFQDELTLSVFFTEVDKAFVKKQFDNFTGRSLLQKCLDNRVEAKLFLQEQEEAAIDVAFELRMAAFMGDIYKLDFLLAREDKGQFIDSFGEKTGKTALHQAASKKQAACLQKLLEAGATLTIKDNEGHTALDILNAMREKLSVKDKEAMEKVEECIAQFSPYIRSPRI